MGEMVVMVIIVVVMMIQLFFFRQRFHCHKVPVIISISPLILLLSLPALSHYTYKAYEQSIRTREAAALGLSSVESLVEDIGLKKQMLQRVLLHRVEAEKYNASTAMVRTLLTGYILDNGLSS